MRLSSEKPGKNCAQTSVFQKMEKHGRSVGTDSLHNLGQGFDENSASESGRPFTHEIVRLRPMAPAMPFSSISTLSAFSRSGTSQETSPSGRAHRSGNNHHMVAIDIWTCCAPKPVRTKKARPVWLRFNTAEFGVFQKSNCLFFLQAERKETHRHRHKHKHNLRQRAMLRGRNWACARTAGTSIERV